MATKRDTMTTKTMTKHDKLVDELNKLGACSDAVEWFMAGKFKSKHAAWKACKRPDWLLWILASYDLRDETKDRLFACRCVRETPLADGRKVLDLLTDERSRNAVEVAERFCRGEATRKELDAAWAAAWDAARDAARDAAWDAQANYLREVYGDPFKREELRKGVGR